MITGPKGSYVGREWSPIPKKQNVRVVKSVSYSDGFCSFQFSKTRAPNMPSLTVHTWGGNLASWGQLTGVTTLHLPWRLSTRATRHGKYFLHQGDVHPAHPPSNARTCCPAPQPAWIQQPQGLVHTVWVTGGCLPCLLGLVVAIKFVLKRADSFPRMGKSHDCEISPRNRLKGGKKPD